MKRRYRVIYFGFIAFIMLSEMITSNVYSLFGPLEETAELMGVTVGLERIRLIILIVLDAIPGIGAVLAIRAYANPGTLSTGRIGVFATTIGMIVYGAYQVFAATFQLGNMRMLVTIVGITYPLLGIGAWFVGADLRRGNLLPDGPTVQEN